MVKLRIKEAAEERGITTAYQLQKLMNIQPTSAYRLWNGEMEMVGMKTLDAVCEALGCTPAELFSYTPNKKKK